MNSYFHFFSIKIFTYTSKDEDKQTLEADIWLRMVNIDVV